MKKIYSAEHIVSAGHVLNLLESNGIPCLLLHENLAGALGELPALECGPEVWLHNEADYGRAQRLLDAFHQQQQHPGEPWTCAGCQEQLEGPFSHCWRCGRERPETVTD